MNVHKMEGNSLEIKYHKLASEYSKLRAQASVLKKAVLDEQGKNLTLRDQLRQRETSLRRSEQEVDSLDFRNKQLEHRVASLQEEVATLENKKKEKDKRKLKGNFNDTNNLVVGTTVGYENAQDAIIFEELQKKIMENAHLTLSIDEKQHELQLYSDRISSLEKKLEKRCTENGDLEKRLRRDIEILQVRNSDLETRLVEAASMLGSEDALSASGSDTTPLHTATNTNPYGNSNEDRIAFLEKEVSRWRTQCEIAKISDSFPNDIANRKDKDHKLQQNCLKTSQLSTVEVIDGSCNCSSAAAGITVMPSTNESKRNSEDRKTIFQEQPPVPPSKEQFIFNNFSKKFEDILKSKCHSESRFASYEVECVNLQNCLEDSSRELKQKIELLQGADRTIQTLEEDLATTRINYEEQISVLTEQVISLSEQLASCK